MIGDILKLQTGEPNEFLRQLGEEKRLFTKAETKMITLLKLEAGHFLEPGNLQGFKSLEACYQEIQEERLLPYLLKNRLFCRPEPIIDLIQQKVFAYHLSVKWVEMDSYKIDLYQLFKQSLCWNALDSFERLLGIEQYNRLVVGMKAEKLLREASLVAQFVKSLKKVTRQLVLKLTDLPILENPQAIQPSMEDYRALGVQFALEEVEAGFSSLVELAQLKPEIAVINFKQLTGFLDERARMRMLQVLFHIADLCGIQLLVENIQNETELAQLRKMGLNLIQAAS